MSGIYIHVPFCKQACSYCDFHFSTTLKLQQPMVDALCNEIRNRAQELSAPPRSIYFGGGSPSILTPAQLQQIMRCLNEHFDLRSVEEITLESNPDDHSPERLEAWKECGINRLSIGIQSFIDRDLQWMNRAHHAEQARHCVERARRAGFEAMSIDLIYGIPGQSLEEWQSNIAAAIALGVDHISAYCLTIEPKTALIHQLKRGEFNEKPDERIEEEYHLLEKQLSAAGYEHYEVSNFCKPEKRAVHNSMYWQRNPYLGIGPSAHSFDGARTRSWNVANNAQYIKFQREGKPACSSESLSEVDVLNECIMTSLRTAKGISLEQLSDEQRSTLNRQIESLPSYLSAHLSIDASAVRIPSASWLKCDAIIRELFVEEIS